MTDAEKIAELERRLSAVAEPAAATVPDRCKTTRDAEAYLKGKGYSCVHTTIVRAIKSGKLQRAPDGTILFASLDTFALAHCELLGGESLDEKSQRLNRERQEHEIRKLAAEADRRELQLGRERGALVERSRMEKELAARAIQLRGDFEAWAHEVPLRIVDQWDLGADAIGDLRKMILDAGKEWFGRYTDTREYVTPLLPTGEE